LFHLKAVFHFLIANI